MVQWITNNKEWLFSGLLVAVPIAFVGWLFAARRSRLSQTQRSGDNSFNIQVGGNLKMRRNEDDDGTDSKSGK